MFISFSPEEISAITAFAVQSEDCEQIGENEFVLDLYDFDPPATIDIVVEPAGVRVDGAAYLQFDEEMDGWYMSAQIENPEFLLRKIVPPIPQIQNPKSLT